MRHFTSLLPLSSILLVSLACGSRSTALDGLAPVGVAECDAYLDLARTCLASAPDKLRPSVEKEARDNHALWTKASAAGGLARESLTTTCRTATSGLTRNPACR